MNPIEARAALDSMAEAQRELGGAVPNIRCGGTPPLLR